MRPWQGTWADLYDGAYMKDKAGTTWKVIGMRDDGYVLVQNRDGEKKVITPKDPRTQVTLLAPTDAEAQKTIEDVLGGGLLAEKYKGARVWNVGAFRTRGPAALIDAKAHLHMMHGVWANDIKTIEEAHEAHKHLHAEPETSAPGSIVPHHHG